MPDERLEEVTRAIIGDCQRCQIIGGCPYPRMLSISTCEAEVCKDLRWFWPTRSARGLVGWGFAEREFREYTKDKSVPVPVLDYAGSFYTPSEYLHLWRCGDHLRKTGNMRGLHWPALMRYAVDEESFRKQISVISWASRASCSYEALASFLEAYSQTNPVITTLYQQIIRTV